VIWQALAIAAIRDFTAFGKNRMQGWFSDLPET
jgi:hypothetical protein